MPFEATRWAGEQQHGQDHQRSGDEREKKCPEKTHSALDAAKSCENTENYVNGGFEHGPRSRRSSAVALRRAKPLPEQSACARTRHELVAVAPVVESVGLEELGLDAELVARESHISLWALTNSR